jgi:pyridoxine/pyridoxamine 5'-phosphate oxidase
VEIVVLKGMAASDGLRFQDQPKPISPNEQTVAVEEASVDPDPMAQLSSWLEVAGGAGEPMPDAMAVATATTEGRPSSRMVLLRGIDHRGLVF